MIQGIGIDIIEIDRIKAAVKAHGKAFINRIFTPQEIKYCTSRKSFKFPELSARFAAKEAYSKAIGLGLSGLRWKEVEVGNDKSGKPYLSISGKKQKNLHITLSHSLNYAVAMVVIDEE
jgi:holo-[acyl-carrier protein] synthase